MAHLHCEREAATLANAIRIHLDLPLAGLYYLLDNSQSQSYALVIHGCRPMQLAKSIEQDWNLIFCDAHASVNHLDSKHAGRIEVLSYNLNQTVFGELKGVLYQIVQHLLESSAVAH